MKQCKIRDILDQRHCSSFAPKSSPALQYSTKYCTISSPISSPISKQRTSKAEAAPSLHPHKLDPTSQLHIVTIRLDGNNDLKQSQSLIGL